MIAASGSVRSSSGRPACPRARHLEPPHATDRSARHHILRTLSEIGWGRANHCRLRPFSAQSCSSKRIGLLSAVCKQTRQHRPWIYVHAPARQQHTCRPLHCSPSPPALHCGNHWNREPHSVSRKDRGSQRAGRRKVYACNCYLPVTCLVRVNPQPARSVRRRTAGWPHKIHRARNTSGRRRTWNAYHLAHAEPVGVDTWIRRSKSANADSRPLGNSVESIARTDRVRC